VPLPIRRELVIVDDCSSDGSRDIVKSFPFKSEVIFHEHTENRGKGAALHAGIRRATGDFIGIQDADFEYSVDDIQGLLMPLIEGRADVVFGSRFKKDCRQVHRTFHYMVNRFLTLLSNLASGLFLSDMETCYKFFKADIIKGIALESLRFGFEPEVTAKIARLDLRVMELPISYFPRNYAQGKKITWRDGVAAIRHIVYFNLIADRKRWYDATLPPHYVPEGRLLL
jgi:glycosyltransferase involved in cell wall biosynthesis